MIGLDKYRDARGRAISNDKLPWRLRDHALFVAYAPIDKPRYAVAVIVEHGVSGSQHGRADRARPAGACAQD